jgi:hypothetical protein
MRLVGEDRSLARKASVGRTARRRGTQVLYQQQDPQPAAGQTYGMPTTALERAQGRTAP